MSTSLDAAVYAIVYSVLLRHDAPSLTSFTLSGADWTFTRLICLVGGPGGGGTSCQYCLRGVGYKTVYGACGWYTTELVKGHAKKKIVAHSHNLQVVTRSLELLSCGNDLYFFFCMSLRRLCICVHGAIFAKIRRDMVVALTQLSVS